MDTYYICSLFLLFISVSLCERLHEQIYSTIEGGAACFRRLNGTHQAGCSSSLSGAVGVVHMIQNTSDAEWLVYNSTAGPYMAIVDTVVFYDIIELLMKNPANVAGILLYDNPAIRPDAFSQESRCPNEYSGGPGSQCSSSRIGGIVWNEKGTDLIRRDIPFPMFFLPQPRITEIDKIKECFQKYNSDLNNQKGQPLCSLQLNSFMYAAVNSAVCLRRSASSALLTSTKVCDPLGDYNVYYSLFPRAKETETKKRPVTLVTARIDSASLFDGVAPGASSSVVGMVTEMVAATALAQMIPVADMDLYDKNVLWTLFNGESFDYIGSQRVAYDIARGAWPPISPLSPSDIDLHIELGQIGGSFQLFKDNASWPLYAYAPYDQIYDIPQQVNEFLQEMLSNTNKNNMTIVPEFSLNLPPSSLHSFRRILRNGNETEIGLLPEVLIVDFKETFSNKFYQSALDDHESIGFVYHNISIGSEGEFLSTTELLSKGLMKDTEAQIKIARLATSLAHTLYQQVAGKPYSGDVAASAHLVDEMLYCFLRSQACRLLAAADYAGGDEAAAARAAPLYVGVAAWASAPALYAGHLLALLTGMPVLLDRAACDKYDQELARERASKTGARPALPLYVGSARRAGAGAARAARLLALLTGTRHKLDRHACNKVKKPGFSHYWLKGWNHSGVCIRTTMNFSQAVSPAFVKPDYDMSSGEFSTWTESVWQTMWARVFVRASGAGARLAAAAGAAATLAAAALTYWLQRHRDLIFTGDAVSVHGDATGIIRTVNC